MNLKNENLAKTLLNNKEILEKDLHIWKEAIDYWGADYWGGCNINLAKKEDKDVLTSSHYRVFINDIPFNEMKEFAIKSLTKQISEINEKLKTL